ncbi:hypothetical protein BKK79_17580 [Cupriavidus sp. USMAA2-4]|uniref:tail assembly protein n=1 Tax=Cupriavidus sp. USMAA2-4 TaxID=876364 RepID=UPI0008A71156|nr:tail assembly protein [Cupriavidus sp. USMAA2-4]AOY93408.1 hypothetical protein BKK79_17580 [Cupriavidus sp. USMAA2-4]
MDQVRTIRLYGKLGAKFGRVHRYVFNSASGALRALCAMVPGFEAELMSSRERGVRYAVFAGKRNLGEKQLGHPCGSDDVRIAPVLVGSKSGGLLQTIAGAVLVVVGAVMTYFPATAAYGPNVMMLGAGMMLGGIAQMMAPHQTTQDSNGLQSYNLNGAENVTQQGGPVPLLYGRMRVGSVVISEGMLAQDGKAQLVGGQYLSTT